MLKTKHFNRGDTLIEVLFATAVFSLVAVGALSIMNQGTATSQRALEITLVRQQIDAQAETLRFLNASYVAAYQSGTVNYPNTPADEWRLLKAEAKTPTIGASSLGICPSSSGDFPDGSFVLNTHTAKFVESTNLVPAKTFSQIEYNSDDSIRSVDGIWVEAVSSEVVVGSNSGYIDFHIRACWDSPGQSVPVTLGTIVRLYEPRG